MLLSEHVYCVAAAFKMTEGIEQWICIRFFIKLRHSSMETIRMTQKAAAMGNWWLAASSQQCTCSCMTSRGKVLGKPSNHPGDSVPYSPDLESCNFWLFSKLKSLLKGKFQTISEIQENARSSSWRLRGLCKVPRCLLWRGLRHHCLMHNISCILYILQ